MAAMIWDEQAQAFTEADTPMKHDPSVGVWTDTTGLAWDNEAQAWTERWNSGARAYVYGAALETVTIRKDGIVIATVQTDSSGCSSEKITLPYGTYDMTGSVSGWTEEQEINDDTTKFRAMPEGAVYWYGNICDWLTGGFTQDVVININYENPKNFVFNTNYIKANYCSAQWQIAMIASVKNVDISRYSSINFKAYVRSNGSPHGGMRGYLSTINTGSSTANVDSNALMFGYTGTNTGDVLVKDALNNTKGDFLYVTVTNMRADFWGSDADVYAIWME